MARRKHGHGMSSDRKLLKKVVNYLFKGLGIAAAAGPGAQVIYADLTGGNAQNIGADALYAYTGIGSSGIDFKQTVQGIGAVGGGVLLFWLGSQLARRI